jgi:hypothetical protein
MIGKAKAISHGINNLRYIMGESENKKHPEKINVICSQHLPSGLDAIGVWEAMQATTAGYENLKNTLIQVELSPAKENTRNFTFKDWKNLWKDFVEEFDKQTIKNKDGKVTSRPTHVADSKAIVCLHEESKGGIFHLHGAISRVDENGNVNNDHDIHLRAQRAAEAVARKRGWSTALDVRSRNVKHIAAICENVLKSMPTWSWENFVSRIENFKDENLKVKARTDSLGNIKGYAIIDDDAKYKASELGRHLTYSKLYSTWWKLHSARTAETEERRSSRSAAPTSTVQQNPPIMKKESLIRERTKKQPLKSGLIKKDSDKLQQKAVSKHDYTVWAHDRQSVDINVDDAIHRYFLPKDVLQLFDDIFDYREIENYEPLINLSCAYYAGAMPLYTPTAGGGGSPKSKWWHDDEEDDIEFARRCAEMAKRKIGLKKKSQGFHR